MNNDSQTPDSDDQDLSRLFDAQQDTVPDALDRLILAAAKDAVSEPAMTVRKRPGTAVKGWFAVAATLLLGVAIAPLLLQAPESTLDGTASSSSKLKAVAESMSMSAEQSVPESLDSDPNAGSSAPREEAPMSIASPVMPAIQAQSRSVMTSSRSLTQDKRTADDEQYRRSPESWLEKIRRLVKDDLPAEARTEYSLFRKAYPDYSPDFALDAEPK